MEQLPNRAERVAQAMKLLCGKKPPADLVAKWLAGDESHCMTGVDSLQDWAAQHAKLPWLMGITICEAAEALAADPDEGMIGRIEQDYEREHGCRLPYLWWEE